MSKSNAVIDQSEYKLSCERPVVVGLGATGVSVLRYLLQQGFRPQVVDSRLEPPGLAEVKALAPGIEVHLGELAQDLLLQADLIVVSPGVDLQTPLWRQVRAAEIEICGDIELFVRAVQVPIIAITGTNGKTSVVSMLAEILRTHGISTATIGTLTGLLTTPESPELQRELRKYCSDGVEVVAMEVSSHSLVQKRVDETYFSTVAFWLLELVPALATFEEILM